MHSSGRRFSDVQQLFLEVLNKLRLNKSQMTGEWMFFILVTTTQYNSKERRRGVQDKSQQSTHKRTKQHKLCVVHSHMIFTTKYNHRNKSERRQCQINYNTMKWKRTNQNWQKGCSEIIFTPVVGRSHFTALFLILTPVQFVRGIQRRIGYSTKWYPLANITFDAGKDT